MPRLERATCESDEPPMSPPSFDADRPGVDRVAVRPPQSRAVTPDQDRDPATLRAELASVREQYNSVRPHLIIVTGLYGVAAWWGLAFPQLDGSCGVRGSGPGRAQGTTKQPLTWRLRRRPSDRGCPWRSAATRVQGHVEGTRLNHS